MEWKERVLLPVCPRALSSPCGVQDPTLEPKAPTPAGCSPAAELVSLVDEQGRVAEKLNFQAPAGFFPGRT